MNEELRLVLLDVRRILEITARRCDYQKRSIGTTGSHFGAAIVAEDGTTQHAELVNAIELIDGVLK